MLLMRFSCKWSIVFMRPVSPSGWLRRCLWSSCLSFFFTSLPASSDLGMSTALAWHGRCLHCGLFLYLYTSPCFLSTSHFLSCWQAHTWDPLWPPVCGDCSLSPQPGVSPRWDMLEKFPQPSVPPQFLGYPRSSEQICLWTLKKSNLKDKL